MNQTPTRNISTWTRREKLARVLWSITHALIFRTSFHNLYGFRANLLRCFGAKIGKNVRIRPTVRIDIPWNLTIADDVSLGDFVVLYALGPITIGKRTFISQYSHLCAGTHDYTRRDYPLLRLPITIGEDCWIAARAFLAPDVTIGDRSVVGAGAVIVNDVPPDQVWAGNPARFIKQRKLEG